jgi:uncharacterized protein YqgV (UPF0045/DUF77 family)
MFVSAQVSLYPLGQSDLWPAIKAVWQALDKHGLGYRPGPMSTLVEGEAGAMFAALHDAFEAAAGHGNTVMVFTLSNACPPLSSLPAEVAHA